MLSAASLKGFALKAPLPIPKLWQSRSAASYIPLVPEGREGLGEKGGASLKVKGFCSLQGEPKGVVKTIETGRFSKKIL